MKRTMFIFTLLVGLLLVGCSADGETVTVEPIRVVAVTETAVLETSTAVPSTLSTDIPTPSSTATATASPLAPTTTNTPQPTKTNAPTTQIAAPPPPGRIAFLWSPYPRPDGSDPSLTTNFYIASPGESIEQWQTEPIITDLFSSPLMRVSPDFSQAAILFAENEELTFNEIRKISTYDFAANEIEDLTDNQCCLYNFTWLADSQAVIYSQVHNLFITPLNGSPSEPLTINGLSPDSEIFSPIVSPDGMRLAFTTSNPNSLVLYNLSNDEYATVGEISYPSSYLTIAWSRDSEWLAFTDSFNQGLSLVNAESLDTIQLRDTSVRCFPTWATNTSSLAFTCDNTIYLWDDTTQTTQELVKAELLGPPAWSPDNSLLAASFTNGDQTGLLLADPIEGGSQELRLNPAVRPAIWTAPAWSPDANWLLVLSEPTEQDTHPGIYIIDRLSGIPYRLMDTTGLQQPYDFAWLPTD